ncbi:MAG: sensor histidine kinase [Acidimicrobiales bacterium]
MTEQPGTRPRRDRLGVWRRPRRKLWSARPGVCTRLGVRTRVALVAALAVAVAVLSSSGVVYLSVHHDLVARVDTTLEHHAKVLARRDAARGLAGAFQSVHREAPGLTVGPFAQVVASDGAVLAREDPSVHLPVGVALRQVASGEAPRFFTSETIGALAVRVLVTPFGAGRALEVVQPDGELVLELDRLAVVLVATAAGGVLVAVLLGAAVAGVALRPVRRLTVAAERLAATRDLAEQMHVDGKDELSRLASSINTLLAALQRSRQSQRQLVADASHELRTPLTSLRTNVEVLAGPVELDPDARRQLVADVAAELDALTRLVADIIDLARQEGAPASPDATQVVAFDALVASVVDRLERVHPRLSFETDLSPVLVRGVPGDLERLASNVVDNAAKWSPEGATVSVRVVESTSSAGAVAVLVVEDHGPGISPEDLLHVFDRFYRGGSARRVPGSGLGLAIVKRIVDAHRGDVGIEPAPGGGTRVVVSLPALDQGEAGET